jgi:hypothetical protein
MTEEKLIARRRLGASRLFTPLRLRNPGPSSFKIGALFSDPHRPGSVVSDAILMAGNSSPILLKS